MRIAPTTDRGKARAKDGGRLWTSAAEIGLCVAEFGKVVEGEGMAIGSWLDVSEGGNDPAGAIGDCGSPFPAAELPTPGSSEDPGDDGDPCETATHSHSSAVELQ